MSGLDRLLNHVIESEGSDLHLASGEAPRLRRHGVLVPVEGVRPPTADELSTLLQAICPPDTWALLARHHDADFAYEAAGVGRFRVNVFRTASGPAAVFRSISGHVPRLDALGLPPAAGALADLERGLVLVAGPTGSGKSTTMAALVDRINRTSARHIVTIEDPIEHVHGNLRSVVSHRQVGVHGRTFAEALRAAMRQDADVILVGEMRDEETLDLALSASEMGALVLGTLHTSDVPRTIDRVLDAFAIDQQGQVRTILADTLQAVLAQRLVPTADGRGRVAAVELLLRTPALPAILRDGRSNQLRTVIQGGRSLGMQTMDDALYALVEAGRILPQDAWRRATDPERFAPLLQSQG